MLTKCPCRKCVEPAGYSAGFRMFPSVSVYIDAVGSGDAAQCAPADVCTSSCAPMFEGPTPQGRWASDACFQRHNRPLYLNMIFLVTGNVPDCCPGSAGRQLTVPYTQSKCHPCL